MPTPSSSTPRAFSHLLLTLTLTLAATLRMGWPGLTEFKADEARLYTLAADMAAGNFALRGIGSSVGVPNFPMSVWLYSLPLLVWQHPYSATLFTGLLNTLAALLVWLFARRIWPGSVIPALVATVLFTVSPWAVLYSRKIWAQDLLPVFVVGWAFAAYLTYAERRPRWMLVHLLCLAIAAQIHLAAFALIPATGILALRFINRVPWRWVLIGSAVSALTAAPFAVYLLQSGLPLPTASGDAALSLTLSADSWRYTALIALGQQIYSLAGPVAFEAYLAGVPSFGFAHVLTAAFIVVGLLALTHTAWANRATPTPQSDAAFILLVWLLTPPLVFTLQLTPVYPHYFIATLPAAYLVAAAAPTPLLPGPKIHLTSSTATPDPASATNDSPLTTHPEPTFARLATPVVLVVILLTAILHAYSWLSIFNFTATNATPDGFGTPLRRQLAELNAARLLLDTGAATELLIVGPGQFPATDELPAVYAALLRGVDYRYVNAELHALFPADPAAVLLLDPASPAAALYTTHADLAATLPRRANETPVTLYRTTTAPAPPTPLNDPRPFANFTTVTGTDASWTPAALIWRLYYTPGPADPAANYTFFNHLLDDTGQRLTQADAVAYPAAFARPGDLIITTFTLTRPATLPTNLTLRVGLYNFPDTTPIPILDAAANPSTDGLSFPVALPP